MSILEELFYGNICPAEKFLKNDGEYKNNLKEILENIDKLFSHLSEEDKRLSENIFDGIFSLNSISEKEYYIDGLCFGIRLMYETINYKSENFI